jgi:hypothetical protein
MNCTHSPGRRQSSAPSARVPRSSSSAQLHSSSRRHTTRHCQTTPSTQHRHHPQYPPLYRTRKPLSPPQTHFRHGFSHPPQRNGFPHRRARLRIQCHSQGRGAARGTSEASCWRFPGRVSLSALCRLRTRPFSHAPNQDAMTCTPYHPHRTTPPAHHPQHQHQHQR